MATSLAHFLTHEQSEKVDRKSQPQRRKERKGNRAFWKLCELWAFAVKFS
jgi:hypothetical protein